MDFNEVKQTNTNLLESVQCEHCSIKSDIVYSFLSQLHSTLLALDGDELNTAISNIAGEYFDEIYEEGQRVAYQNIAGFALHNIDHIDGTVEEY